MKNDKRMNLRIIFEFLFELEHFQKILFELEHF